MFLVLLTFKFEYQSIHYNIEVVISIKIGSDDVECLKETTHGL